MRSFWFSSHAQDGVGINHLVAGGVFGKLVTCILYAMAAAGSCVPRPVHIPVSNVSLSNHMVARGVSMSVGQPEQSFAFMPLWPNNNTFLYGTNGLCDDSAAWSTVGCTTFRGGAYDSSSSKSAVPASLGSYPIDKEGAALGPSMRFVADRLVLDENTSIVDFPLGVALNDWGEQHYTPMMSIGLGENSTLLNALKAAGHMASRTFGFYMGQRGSSNSRPLDGGLVLGGYDKAKTVGTGYVADMLPASDSCPTGLVVNVSDLVMNFVNGSDESIWRPDMDSFGACINPSTPTIMRLPLVPYALNFIRLGGNDYEKMDRTLGLWYYNMRYGIDQHPFDGDLTVKLTSGLSVRIPNSLLVVPDIYIGTQSGDIIVNNTKSVLALDPNQGQNSDDLAQFGSQFLAAAYLMVNQDAAKFTLWPANPTTNVDLVAVDETGHDVTNICTTQTPGVVNGGGVHPLPPVGSLVVDTPPSQTPSSSDGTTLSSAMIGAIVAGCFVFVLLTFGVWLLFTRRNRRFPSIEPDPVALEGQDPSGNTASGSNDHEKKDSGAAELATAPGTGNAGTKPTSPPVHELDHQPITMARMLPDHGPRDFTYELSA